VPASQLKGVALATETTLLYKPVDQLPTAMQTFYKQMQGVGVTKFTVTVAAAAIAYDTVILADMAATQAGSLDTVAMTHALENLTQPAQPQYVSYPVEQFSATSHNPIFAAADVAALGSPTIDNGLNLPATSQ